MRETLLFSLPTVVLTARHHQTHFHWKRSSDTILKKGNLTIMFLQLLAATNFIFGDFLLKKTCFSIPPTGFGVLRVNSHDASLLLTSALCPDFGLLVRY